MSRLTGSSQSGIWQLTLANTQWLLLFNLFDIDNLYGSRIIFKKKPLPHLFKKLITDQHLSKHVQATRVTISNRGWIIGYTSYTSLGGVGGWGSK
jgi:hypothetical protein